MKKIFCAALMAAGVLPAMAHTVLLSEDFQESTWTTNFSMYDLDHNAPLATFNPIFMDENGVSQPWWTARDTSSSKNRFLVSHSGYNPAGQSNDWLVSRALTIPTEGFILFFDAESLQMRSADHALSDLELYITEQPVTADWQPAEPVKVFKDVPLGATPDVCDDEFTSYQVSLDDYAGKTVYIAFANRNTDRDILALDNIVVQRLDAADMTASAPELAVQGDFNVDVTIQGTLEGGIKDWTLTFQAGETTLTKTGASLAKDEKKDFTFTGIVKGDQSLPWTVTLSSADSQPIVRSGSIHGLLFEPEHRVLLEETTGTRCGNCPQGIYTIECLEEELGEKVIPVSLHTDTNGTDPMSSFISDYAYQFGVNGAPAFRMERGKRVLYVGDNDFTFDPTNPASLGYTVTQRANELTFAGMDMEAKYVDDNGTTKIQATVTMTPAMTIDGSRYKIGFILIENNVTLNNTLWFQENYLHGFKVPGGGNMNGWTLLPEVVPGVHYQDVARANYGYWGLAGSTPDAPMAPGQGHVFETTFDIPNTYTAVTNPNGQSTVTSPAINQDNLELVAYLIDTKEGTGVVNAVKTPMSDKAEPKFTTLDLCKALGIDTGVEGIEADTDAPAEYYTIDGIRVAEPTNGIYIVRRGNKTTKEIIR